MEKTIYDRVKALSLPFIESYHDDLNKHDKRAIGENPGTPFLHFTGSTGTYIVFLNGPDEYPASGEVVPHIFGVADRYEALRNKVESVRHMDKVNRTDLILHYDGLSATYNLKDITFEKALSIMTDYERDIKTYFAKGLKPVLPPNVSPYH